MKLPEDFLHQARETMGTERFERYLASFEEETPVSIHLNPKKAAGFTVTGTSVPWCRGGYYLPERPNFTFDPLFHAGLYYVQEASSMFLDEVLRQCLGDQPLTFLDMCAAPGGKSTLIRSALPEGSILVSNEPMRNRAQVLAENMQKWGYADSIVTNKYPRDFRKSGLLFDAILCDVPCSGEGMFRKDKDTIGEWSLQNVEKCWRLQREIVGEAWQCLREGGLLIYSTCTFNLKENEENIRWITEELEAEVIPIATNDDWHITHSLLPGFHEPVYRFIPGITRGEGLFMAALRKPGDSSAQRPELRAFISRLSSLTSHLSPPPPQSSPTAELTYAQAISYLRREAILLPPDTPKGLITVTFQNVPLGQVKNIGSRANNLYPKEWRIRTTHIPQEYETILRHT